MKRFSLLTALFLGATGANLTALPEAAFTQDVEAITISQAEPQPTSTLQLLSTGAAPRQEFRFKATVGTEQTSKIAIDATTLASFGDQKLPPISFPTITMTVDTEVIEVSETGDTTATFVYSDVELSDTEGSPSALADLLKEQLGQIVGLKGTLTFDAQGNLRDFEVELPSGGDEATQQILSQMSDALQQLSNPFPNEAIGIGAQWQVPQNLSINGLEFTQIATYELIGYEGDQLHLKFGLEQRGGGQLVNLPGLPPGIEPNLEALESTGSGEVTLDLTQLMPTQLAINSVTDMVMAIAPPGSAKEVKIDMSVSAQITASSEN